MGSVRWTACNRPSPRPTSLGAVGALRAALDGRTMVLSHSTNIRWLTGFGGSLAWVVLDSDRLVLITDGRYGERAAADLAANGLDDALGVELEVRTKRPELTDTVVAAAAAAGGVVRRRGRSSQPRRVVEPRRAPRPRSVRWPRRAAAAHQGRWRAGPDDESCAGRRRHVGRCCSDVGGATDRGRRTR